MGGRAILYIIVFNSYRRYVGRLLPTCAVGKSRKQDSYFLFRFSFNEEAQSIFIGLLRWVSPLAQSFVTITLHIAFTIARFPI